MRRSSRRSRMDAVAGVGAGVLPAPRALRLAEDRCPHRPRGGRAVALDLLARLGRPRRRRVGPGWTGRLAARALSGAGGSIAGGGAGGAGARAGPAQPAEPQGRGAGRGAGADAGGGRGRSRRAAGAGGGRDWAALSRRCDAVSAGGRLAARVLRACAGAVAVQQLGLPVQAVGAVLSARFLDAEPAILWPALAQAVARPLSGRPCPGWRRGSIRAGSSPGPGCPSWPPCQRGFCISRGNGRGLRAFSGGAIPNRWLIRSPPRGSGGRAAQPGHRGMGRRRARRVAAVCAGVGWRRGSCSLACEGRRARICVFWEQ